MPASLQCANNCFLSFLFGEDDCPTSFLLPTVLDESHSALSGKGCPRANGHYTFAYQNRRRPKKGTEKKRVVGRRKGLFRLLLLFLTVLVKSPRVPGSIGGFGIRGKRREGGERERLEKGKKRKRNGRKRALDSRSLILFSATFFSASFESGNLSATAIYHSA